MDLGRAVGAQQHPGGGEVVEALRVADVLEPDGEADAALDTLAAGRVAGAARQADRLARQRLGIGHRQCGRAADHLGGREDALDHLAGRQRVAAAERVQEPELDGVDPELVRELVHLRLGREARLHGTEAAHRAAGRVVRVDAGRLDQRVRDLVGADREAGGVRGHGRRAGGVGAAVEQDPHPHVDELAGPRRPVLAPDPRRMAVDVAEERLLPVVDDLHRPLRVQREHGAVDLHREVLATSERAADAGEVDAHHLGRQAEARRHLIAVDVQPLRRDVDVDAALSVGDGEARLRPEERLILDADVVDAADGDIAFRVRVAVPDDEVADDVRAARPRGSRAPSSAGRGGAAAARSPAPCPRPARSLRTRRGRRRRRGAPARAPRLRPARPARRSSGPGRRRAPAGRRTRARRSSGRARPRA